MKLCTDFNCKYRSNSGQCLLTACINENVDYVAVDNLKVKPDGTFEHVYIITESDLESSIRASLKEIYKEGYYQDTTFNLFSRLMKNYFEKSGKYL